MTIRAGENSRSALKAWVRALERTARLERDPTLIFPRLIEQRAESDGDRPALISPDESWTYRELAGHCNHYARWALHRGLRKGDVVCLLMSNCPRYLAIWLGLSRVGVVVALINTNLSGDALAHSINVVSPRAVIVGKGHVRQLISARAQFAPGISLWSDGTREADLPVIEEQSGPSAAQPPSESESTAVSLADRALFIYTSGTTGLPKAAVVSHYRVARWALWFAGMLDTGPDDRMYNCLPMYHSVGGVVATGASLAAGGAVILRERFSARDFWRDVTAERCTLFQYIGELCRYLLASPWHADEQRHSLRICCGNGLRPDVWEPFQARFRIPQILEYYASTEGSFSLYNCEGRVGSVGRIPPFLSHRMPVALVQFDTDREEPVRTPAGSCVRCAPGEIGEAVGEIKGAEGEAIARFEGYADAAASRKKVLRDVFAPGDAWYRTGDLMRQDDQGFFYFVDRIGDTFRWKGENVSTTEVAAVLAAFPGVRDVAVFGVRVGSADGRAGMAALVTDEHFDLEALAVRLREALPDYARPLFIRIVTALELTATFKLKKSDLIREGFDPTASTDRIFFDDRSVQSYVPLDAGLYERICSGSVRV